MQRATDASMRPNYLWSRPVTPLASIRDGMADVLGPDVLVGADLNTFAVASIRNLIGRQQPHWPRALAANDAHRPSRRNEQRPKDQRVRACEPTALDLDWTPGFAANRGRLH